MRLNGTGLDLGEAGEILSRGVPIGAVEVAPSGELIILLRGRLVTAGYPVVAVLTKRSIDKVSQARAGDQITISLIEMSKAQLELQEIEGKITNTKTRVENAFRSRGWESLLSY
jgi:allophanate hydrolase subunit 2